MGGGSLTVRSVCVLGTIKGGGRQGGSYLFVLPSRRVREQIKGFNSGGLQAGVGGWGGGTQALTIYIKHNEEVTDIKKFSFEVKGSAVEGGWVGRLAELNEG